MKPQVNLTNYVGVRTGSTRRPIPSVTRIGEGQHRAHIERLVMSQRIFAIPAEQSEQSQPATHNNLPLQPTPLIGRKQEAERICQSLLSPDLRLLTLTGPPGVGKTRLSLHVASSLPSSFPDGIFFVNLAPISDPGLVASEIAHTLEVREVGGQSAMERLKAFLRDKRILLLLDNFEQVIEAAPVVAELAQASSGLKLLVTSRMRLHLRGEHEFQVLPLAMPPLDRLLPIEELVKYEAIRLFVERATAIKSDFTVTDRSASAVTEICYRLDGLPLAIELAAARIKILPAQSMALRLQSTLRLLTGGDYDLPARHQTLRAAIEWSHELLNSRERTIFRRLGVFVGGCSLQAVEEMASPEVDALDVIGSLVDKSLVRQDEVGGEPRFTMLETIREYAREKLEESGEAGEIRRHHALYFLELAEQAEPYLSSVEQTVWFNRLDAEHDNLRAMLQWSQSTSGDPKLALRMVAVLGRFWGIRSYLQEGREWLSVVLSKVDAQERTSARGKVLTWAGWLAYFQSDYGSAHTFFEESLAILREQGNKQGIAYALDGLGEIAHYEGDYKTAISHYEEWLSISRELGDIQGIAVALLFLGYAELRLVDIGDHALPVARLEEALTLARQTGIGYRVAEALRMLGEVAVRQGDCDRATSLLQESLGLSRELDNKWGIAASQGTLAWVALLQADHVQAIELLIESMLIRKEIGDKGGIAWCLEKLAEIANKHGDWQRAGRLLGAAKALRDSVGSVVDSADQPDHERTTAVIHAELGEEKFSAAWEAGHTMVLSDPSMEQAIAYALEFKVARPRPPSTTNDTTGLTTREREIAVLIAQSKSNAEIAEAMVITKRTVETHIGNILSKLGFTSRGQIAAWAIKNGLVNDF